MSQASEPVTKTYQPLQTYHLSHDLRGPLNSMLGFTELLLEGIEGPLTEIQIEDITAIRQSATNLLRLINTVVNLGKIGAGQFKLNQQPANLNTIMANVIHSLPEKTVAHAELSIKPTPDMPTLFVDSERIEESVFNILEFLLAKKTTTAITISAAPTESGAVLTIVAAGTVLSTEQLAHLFDLTVEVESTGRSKLTEGGLYIPLAFKLAQLHQGQLTVNSSAPGGTEFCLTLPRYTNSMAESL